MFLDVPLLHETDEHRALRQSVRRFAKSAIAPNALAWEEAGEFPLALYAAAAEAGLTGIGYPEDVGGSGGDLSHVVAAAEELVCEGKSVGTAVGLGSHLIGLPPIVSAGTLEQKERFVRPVLEGKKIAALAITEPGGGSDVAGLRTTARRDGDRYVVNGAKTFITSGTRADVLTVAVRTGGPGHAGLSLLVVEKGAPGLSVSKKLSKMGWWASDTAELAFEDCLVPAANLLGEENQGFLLILRNFANERLMLAGNCLAIAVLAYRESVAYTKERSAFGKTLSAFQVTRHKLAEMATRIAALRAMVSEALVRHARGEDVIGLAAMTKNVATDACSFVVDQAVQLFGGYGYMREQVVERLYRDARLYPIGGGTREIMNEIVSRTEGF